MTRKPLQVWADLIPESREGERRTDLLAGALCLGCPNSTSREEFTAGNRPREAKCREGHAVRQ